LSSQKFERELRREFPECKFERTGKSHLKIILPNGRFIITSNTPSDVRVLRNVRKTMKHEARR
jgi:hypothetical protein